MFSRTPTQPDPKEQEAEDNLVGFFDLLLKIDRRVNPELYRKQQNKKEGQEELREKRQKKKARVLGIKKFFLRKEITTANWF